MRGLVAVAASLVLVAACGGTLPSALPSLDITHPIASAPTEAPTQEPTQESKPTKTPNVTSSPEQATSEPTSEASAQPTEEASAEPTPFETELASVAPGGHVITVIAGGGGQSVAPTVAAINAALQRPTGVAVAGLEGTPDQGRGDIYVVDANLGVEFRIATDGTIQDVNPGLLGPQGVGVEMVAPGSTLVWVADTANSRVVTPGSNGNWLTIAGSSLGVVGFKGDGGPAKRSLLSQPFDVAGSYIADTTNQRVRYVDPQTGDISTVAGDGTQGYSGDGGPATKAEISSAQAIALSPDGTKLFIADYGNFRIREVDLMSDKITTVAGTGDGTSVAFNAKLTGTQTPIQRASAIATDLDGNVYFPVFWGDRGTTIMRLAPDGSMLLVAGGGKSTTPGSDATDFALPDVLGLAIDSFDGSLLICGSDGHVYSVADIAPTFTP